MVRIGGSTDRGKHIHEMDYYTPQGEFRVDREGSPTLLNCLMYKMCYYRFGAVYTESGESVFVFVCMCVCVCVCEREREFHVDCEGSPTLLNCLVYKMCYYGFGAVYTESGESVFVCVCV